MKILILYFNIWIISIAFSQQKNWYSPTSTALNSFTHQMVFREPIIFTPFEIKIGYLNYGGKSYWFDKPYNKNLIKTIDHPVLLDSTQYNFNIINSIKNRTGLFIEADIFRVNLFNYLINQNYFDIQFGFGFQYTDFNSNPSLPNMKGNEWENSSNLGEYYFHPKTTGININTSFGWQFQKNRASYLYHSFGLNSLSIYESEGGDVSLTGTGLSESFGLGTKYIINQKNNNFSYTFGIEIKWNRIYISSIEKPDNLAPIRGLDLRSSGIFLTTGIQFGGKQTNGDIAYAYMIKNDFISAAEYFEKFLSKQRKHGKRQKALSMLQYCKSQIPYQKVNYGSENIFETNYEQAVDWFNSAEKNANDKLKIEIESYRLDIVNAIIDSVQTNKNNMSIEESKKLMKIAVDLSPKNKLVNQILAGLYYDQGILNTDIKNYDDAIENYFYAIELYSPIETIVEEKINELILAIIKDSYFLAEQGELQQVIRSLKTIIKLKPELMNEWDKYITNLESKLKYQKEEISRYYVMDYIKNKKQESVGIKSNVLQLGMTYKEVEKLKGSPEIINEMNESNRYFQMWTYNTKAKTTYLYFEEDKLVRIDQ